MTWMRTRPASGWPGGAPHAAGKGVIAGAMVPGDGDVVRVSDAGRGERVVGWLRGVGIGWVGVVSVLATAAVLAASLMLRDRSFEDLAVYRIGVRTWLHGGDMYGPLPPAHPGGLVLPFIYPPFAALVLSPLALLPWPVAWVAMLLLSLVSLVIVVYVTARRLWPGGGRASAVLVTAVGVPASLLLDPVAQTFWFGQVNLLLMALVAVDCLVPSPRWPRGLLVGVAAAIKLTPAAFVLLLVIRRDYRAAGCTNSRGPRVSVARIDVSSVPQAIWSEVSSSAAPHRPARPAVRGEFLDRVPRGVHPPLGRLLPHGGVGDLPGGVVGRGGLQHRPDPGDQPALPAADPLPALACGPELPARGHDRRGERDADGGPGADTARTALRRPRPPLGCGY